MKAYYESPDLTLYHGDSRAVLPSFSEGSVNSIITDPPYELGFMRKAWDKSGVAFDPATWAAVLRVLKPGGYMLAMGGTRTFHRLACAVEDAGFEVRDCLIWLYGTGMPKGEGCLKPAWEPILLCRKPAKRVLPLGIDACRIPCDGRITPERYAEERAGEAVGRYPANVLHDGSDEVMEAFAAFGEDNRVERRTETKQPRPRSATAGVYGVDHDQTPTPRYQDTGTAARFFYCAKASKTERGKGNTHPTVKPLALMRWCVRLVTPEGGTVLDPFAGSGSSLLAGRAEGRRVVGIEQDAAHCAITVSRIGGNPTPEAAPDKAAG